MRIKVKDKPDKRDITIGILGAVYFIIMLLPAVICDVSGIYNSMTGRRGLGNIILVIVLMRLCTLLAAAPVAIFGIRLIFLVRKDEKKEKSTALGIGAAVVCILLIIMLSMNKQYFNEQQHITGKNSDIAVLAACISDYFSDDYDEYTVNTFYFDHNTHHISTGNGGRLHSEYTASGYYGDTHIFKAQIGKDDCKYLKDALPVGFDTKITVYKKSGFIRSIEPTVDFDRAHSYENYYEIYYNDGIITRTEPEGEPKAGNLMWCGFRSGESGNIENSLFGINARNSIEYPYSDLVNYKELCLYGTVDGEYRRVSNIIYSTGRSLGEIAEIYDKQQ